MGGRDGWGRGIMGKRGKGHQGICIKDTWTKPNGGRIQGGRWEWAGMTVGSGGEKMETTILE